MYKKALLIFASLALLLSAPLASPLSAATKTTQILHQLEAKGAKIVPMSKLPQGFAAKPKLKHYSCDHVACWCFGGHDCHLMLAEKGASCSHVVGGNDFGHPVCWCDL